MMTGDLRNPAQRQKKKNREFPRKMLRAKGVSSQLIAARGSGV
jgi:hypothetical protein